MVQVTHSDLVIVKEGKNAKWFGVLPQGWTCESLLYVEMAVLDIPKLISPSF